MIIEKSTISLSIIHRACSIYNTFAGCFRWIPSMRYVFLSDTLRSADSRSHFVFSPLRTAWGGQHVRDECTRPSHATFTRWGPCSWQKRQLSTPTRQWSRGGQHVRDECTRPSHATFTRWGPCSWQKRQLSTLTRQRSRGGQHVRDECTRPSHVLPHSPDVVPAPGRSASCQLPPGSGHEEVNM